jgi:hypothetical protein
MSNMPLPVIAVRALTTRIQQDMKNIELFRRSVERPEEMTIRNMSLNIAKTSNCFVDILQITICGQPEYRNHIATLNNNEANNEVVSWIKQLASMRKEHWKLLQTAKYCVNELIFSEFRAIVSYIVCLAYELLSKIAYWRMTGRPRI